MELRELIPLVLSSWQILAAGLVIFIYIFAVSRLARVYSGSRRSGKAKQKKQKVKKAKKAGKGESSEVVESAENANAELGLEEN
ncbi:MAG: hypothetical protein FWG66_03945 [Spirochaetes bacterium]|nr:hypothetical protein [Spirochaetota bacterium]